MTRLPSQVSSKGANLNEYAPTRGASSPTWRNGCAGQKGLRESAAVRIRHPQHVQRLVQLLLGQPLAVDEAEIDDGLSDRDAVGQRLLRRLRGVLVADVGVQRSDDRRR